ncbi:MAG: malto-oligosyltrehalose synthase [Betaproteobacteria bacterium]|nr:malto-oligosyltrehalose synthase [Betaproteobacteria bacterium]
MNGSALDRLCELAGIAAGHTDIWGKQHRPSDATRVALLRAMGIVEDAAGVEAALKAREERLWQRALAPVAVLREDALPYCWEIVCEEQCGAQVHRFSLALETGETHTGEFLPLELPRLAEHAIEGVRYLKAAFEWRKRLPLGYHRFTLQPPEGAAPSVFTLIIAPGRCYTPPALEGAGRVWGTAVQLYALRSARNWGIGDFSDLRNAIEIAGRAGAGIVGVNPLHALFPHNPDHISPYSPSSRACLNVLYLDVEAVPEFAECETARAAVATPEFESRLRALRAAELVDYRGVAEAKLWTLRALYDHFRERHLAAHTARGEAFLAYQRSGGEPLARYALFQALQEDFHARDERVWGWPVWPEPYRDPASPQVRAFLEANGERIEFHTWLQWLAEEQLAACGRRSWELGLGVGLYQDLAVSADRAGAETWAWQSIYAETASIGSPPDDFNLNGQNWGLPPPIPEALAECAYAPFVATLRANMRHAGALRIDHVMGLMRLFWIPPGGKPADGAYVHYPLQDLLGVLALESRRNRCLVVGEDLGTVPDAVREALAPLGVLSYRLLLFEKEHDGGFKAPAAYPAQALAAASTHDLPTLKGMWIGHDLDLREKLGLYPSDEQRERQVIERAQDRARLLVALQREGLLPAGVTVHPVSAPEMTPEFALAIHTFLARSPARVMMVQMEDVFGQLEQVNLPATSAGYPNWQRKLPLDLEEWSADARLMALVEALRQERGTGALPRVAAPHPAGAAIIPRATYRLQLNREFTFRHAAELVPYLAELGVSHIYCSPYLRARAGSAHGYDIIDHSALNPEIGSRDDFEQFVRTLRAHGMGQIFDMVPNHMGVMGADNAWWMDVLENGEASVYAGYFDIDWQPVDLVLSGKVLLPVLGNHYGVVLEQGELRLVFETGRGAFSICYHEHRFPIDPGSYGRILERGLKLAPPQELSPVARNEFESLISAFGHLPARQETAADKRAERNRDKEVHKKRLAALAAGQPALAAGVEAALRAINGTPRERASFDALHALLEAQAYRLAYWRVTSDQINYRRFFDINDLAALRMEDEAVFDATHRLVFELLADGRVDALRIDHPDGLYDPVRYFRRLQERYAPTVASPEASRNWPLYLIAEKITAAHERLPENWPVYGTTGYRFANVVNGLFVDTAAKRRMDRTYRAFAGPIPEFDEVAYQAKHLIMRTALASELAVLANRLARIAQADRRTRDFTLNSLRHALSEVAACFPVYRTYIDERVAPDDRRHIEWAVARAKRRSQAADIAIYDFVQSALLGQPVDGADVALGRITHEFAMKFQQFTAPVAAKGVEDTAFYRYHRLASLNEVGGDPDCFGLTIAAFHGASRDRARRWPHTLLATSTHDNKRAEDVRARINVLSEMPAAWRLEVKRWSRLNRNRKREVEGAEAPSRNDEYLLYQTLIGTWPLPELDEAGRDRYCERIEAYMLKAAREAKQHTSWINHNEAYENALVEFVRGLLRTAAGAPFIERVGPFAARVACIGWINSLSQLTVKITAPGVPDFYQGSELWALDLVDPDNRQPVDYGRRRELLDALKREFDCELGEQAGRARALLDDMADGRVKLYVTWRGLTARREMRALFDGGDYVPLKTSGAHAERLCAFARVHGETASITLAPRLIAGIASGDAPPLGEAAWKDTRLEVPRRIAGRYCNIFTGEVLSCDETGALRAGDVLAQFPVAILTRGDAPQV